ncbi:MAG: hypothetical protein IKA00_11205 [Prevotella sp.]|nr:hypothetical protein [Prevotella sp.]
MKKDTTGKLVNTMQKAVVLLWMDPETFCEWVAVSHGVSITPEQVDNYRTGTVSVMLMRAIEEFLENDKVVDFKEA